MASNRIGRINEEMQKELASLIRNLKDPRVQSTMVSITGVRATPDLRYAKVYVSVFDVEKSKEVMMGLKSAGGWLRREIGSRLQLRYTPELVFEEEALNAVADKAIERKIGARGLRAVMEGLLTDIMFDIPSDPTVVKATITPACVRGEEQPVLERDESKESRPAQLKKGKSGESDSAS